MSQSKVVYSLIDPVIGNKLKKVVNTKHILHIVVIKLVVYVVRSIIKLPEVRVTSLEQLSVAEFSGE